METDRNWSRIALFASLLFVLATIVLSQVRCDASPAHRSVRKSLEDKSLTPIAVEKLDEGIGTFGPWSTFRVTYLDEQGATQTGVAHVIHGQVQYMTIQTPPQQPGQ